MRTGNLKKNLNNVNDVVIEGVNLEKKLLFGTWRIKK